MIIIVMEYSYAVVLRNNSGCERGTEVLRSMLVLWCFAGEAQYLFKKRF